MLNRQKLITYTPLAIFGVLILILVASLRHSTTSTKFAQHVGDPAPVTDLPLLHGAGARFTTSLWQGKPYIINFFASWCADCRLEHEELMTLAAGQLPLVGIVFKDKSDKVAAYLDKAGNPFVMVAQDDDGRAGMDWGLTGIPETFVIDSQGIIRWHYIGNLTDSVVSDDLMPVWESVSQKGG